MTEEKNDELSELRASVLEEANARNLVLYAKLRGARGQRIWSWLALGVFASVSLALAIPTFDSWVKQREIEEQLEATKAMLTSVSAERDGIALELEDTRTALRESLEAQAALGASTARLLEAAAILQEPSPTEYDGPDSERLRPQRRACSEGDGESCNKIGKAYQRGDFRLQKDVFEAVLWFQRGCPRIGAATKSNPKACRNLGFAYLNGVGLPKDRMKAAPLLEYACAEGDADACMGVGFLHGNGLGGLTRDQGQAIGFYSTACTGRSGRGCYLLALAVAKRDGGTDEATTFMDQACKLKIQQACRALGTVEWNP